MWSYSSPETMALPQRAIQTRHRIAPCFSSLPLSRWTWGFMSRGISLFGPVAASVAKARAAHGQRFLSVFRLSIEQVAGGTIVGENGRQHVFVVDDEPHVCDAIRRTLELTGYQVHCFDSAADCLAKMRSVRCDLLVTDVALPGMDGIELLSEVKCRTPSLPVLVVTGYGSIEMAVKAMEAGASNFLQKPLERVSFLAAVEAALRRGGRAHGPMRKPLTKSEAEVDRKSVV